MVKNTGRFKRGHLNVRRIEVTAIRAAAAAQDKRRRARLGVYRAAGTLATFAATPAPRAALSEHERMRAAGLDSAVANQYTVAALLGRSQSAVSKALAAHAEKTPAARGAPRALPVDSSERACLRSLMMEDSDATAHELMWKLRDSYGIELSERTVSRERESFAAEDRTFKLRATNRYARFTSTLLDMHMGFRAGLERATQGKFFDLVYQASPKAAPRRNRTWRRARRCSCALTAPRAPHAPRPRAGRVPAILGQGAVQRLGQRYPPRRGGAQEGRGQAERARADRRGGLAEGVGDGGKHKGRAGGCVHDVRAGEP